MHAFLPPQVKPAPRTATSAAPAQMRVSVPGDADEREAVRAADRLSLAPGPQAPEDCRSQRRPSRAAPGQAWAPPDDAVPLHVRDALRSSGRPLDPPTRVLMERHFAHDFSHVRLHGGAAAGKSAKALRAKAYTIGRDIIFGSGQLSPAAPAGRHLLAHELAHVIQHDVGAAGPGVLRRSPEDGPPMDRPRSTPPPVPTRLPGYMSDVQLIARAKEIAHQIALGELAKRGAKGNPAHLGLIKANFTVAVLQGLRDGKLVTLVSVNSSAYEDLARAQLGASETFVEPLEARKLNERLGTENKSKPIAFDSEQVVGAKSKEIGLKGSRVATSNLGCQDLCISNLRENYPEVRHVNPEPLPKEPSSPAARNRRKKAAKPAKARQEKKTPKAKPAAKTSAKAHRKEKRPTLKKVDRSGSKSATRKVRPAKTGPAKSPQAAPAAPAAPAAKEEMPHAPAKPSVEATKPAVAPRPAATGQGAASSVKTGRVTLNLPPASEPDGAVKLKAIDLSDYPPDRKGFGTVQSGSGLQKLTSSAQLGVLILSLVGEIVGKENQKKINKIIHPIESYFGEGVEEARQEMSAKFPDVATLIQEAGVDQYRKAYESAVRKMQLPEGARILGGTLLMLVPDSEHDEHWHEMAASLPRGIRPQDLRPARAAAAAYVEAMADLQVQLSGYLEGLSDLAADIGKRADVLHRAGSDLLDTFWSAMFSPLGGFWLTYFQLFGLYNVGKTFERLGDHMGGFATQITVLWKDYQRVWDSLHQQQMEVLDKFPTQDEE